MIESDSNTNRPEQGPCNCEQLLHRVFNQPWLHLLLTPDFLPLAIPHLGGGAYPDDLIAVPCLTPPPSSPMFLSVGLQEDTRHFLISWFKYYTLSLLSCSMLLNAYFIIWSNTFNLSPSSIYVLVLCAFAAAVTATVHSVD